uniref:Uncharacterized protein n=1 Tax=Chenopodium quinoa TaxID=63459 RepID=A0A803MIA0_CHEQI
MLAGDFNETMSMDERNGNGGSEMQRRCREFSNWVENNALIDLGCSGPAHTWFRGLTPDTFKSARLDRALSNDEWRLRFEEAGVRNLPKAMSDHCLILISISSEDDMEKISRPFGECEVLAALKSMKPFKAPGPDGFQPLFYQRFWELVHPSVVQLVCEGRDFQRVLMMPIWCLFLSEDPLIEVQDLTVRELWDVNIGWKFEESADYLLALIIGQIASFELVDDEEVVDEVYWNGTPSGGFSIRSAMELMKNSEAASFESVRG